VVWKYDLDNIINAHIEVYVYNGPRIIFNLRAMLTGTFNLRVVFTGFISVAQQMAAIL
jgi:hypothetical protein